MRAQHVHKNFGTHAVNLLTLLFLILSTSAASVEAGQSFTATLSLYEGIDLASGMAVLSSLPAGNLASLLLSPFSTSVSFGDILLFQTSDGQLFIISDLAAASATTLSMRVEAYSGPDSTVPEPSTLLLLGLGLLSIAGIVWRKRMS